jgi:hypothetical protein
MIKKFIYLTLGFFYAPVMQHFFSFINDAGKQKVLEIKLMPRLKPFSYLWKKNLIKSIKKKKKKFKFSNDSID